MIKIFEIIKEVIRQEITKKNIQNWDDGSDSQEKILFEEHKLYLKTNNDSLENDSSSRREKHIKNDNNIILIFEEKSQENEDNEEDRDKNN